MSSNSTGLVALFDFQKSFYIGIDLQAVIYGLDLCVYFKTMHVLLGRRKTPWKHGVFFAVFSTVMLVLITFIYAINASSGQTVWLVDETHSPHPISYAFVDVVAVMSLALQLMASGFMTYRCQVVWDSLHAIIIIPSVFWLAVLALGIVSIWASSTARTSLFGGLTGRLNMAYYSVSVILGTMLTGMICDRLVRYSRMKEKQFGDHAAPHFTIGMFLVESLLPLAVAGIAFVVAYWCESPAEVALLLVYSAMLCLSPQMLILRMAEGNAWQKETTRSFKSAVTFQSHSGGAPPQDHPDRTGTVIRLESLPEETPSTWESGKEDKV